MAIEYPIILAHNLLDGATLSSDAPIVPGHELERMRDGYRHTCWEAPNLDNQTIYIKSPSIIDNPDFVVDLSGWIVAGDGAISRNTDNPLEGNADMQANVNTADDGDNPFYIVNTRPIYLESTKKYTFTIQVGGGGANTDRLRIGFMKVDTLEEVEDNYTEFALTTYPEPKSAEHANWYPTTTGWYFVYIRILQPGTYYLNSIIVNRARGIDTVIIDAGHTLRFCHLNIDMYDVFPGGGSNYDGIISGDGPVLIFFDNPSGMPMRCRIQIGTNPGWNNMLPSIPIMCIGQRWTMPHHFSGDFDPHAEERNEEVSIGERGITQRFLKFNQRVFRADMKYLTAADYENVKDFFMDTENGLKPFYFAWKPTSDPTDILYMRLRGNREVPYYGGTLRNWSFEAEEVAGTRRI